MNKEIWRDVKEYEGLYKVSNNGRVKNKNNKLLKLREDKYGYLIAYLYKNGKMKCKKVHRLVADAFIKNKFNKSQVNHKDGNKKNNCVLNLEWCTNQENIRHCWENNLHKKKFGSQHDGARKILQYDLEGKFIKEWGSIIEASNYYNTTINNIWSCLNKKSKTAKGFIWLYSN